MRHQGQLGWQTWSNPLKKFPIRWFRKKRPAINRTTKRRPTWHRYLRIALINAWKGAAFSLGGTLITWLFIWFHL